ncbi:hypothetical protein DNTS_012969 [Danionella cerebrum]|uniref:DNA-dependent protein kinase catalytic subunit n=1 Tax=Danionella cerebrum TaxID=2873325 RepID=A0A553MU44_9TELE|nr:hypothetical protein DNTS_012969 [Danionella translucida]
MPSDPATVGGIHGYLLKLHSFIEQDDTLSANVAIVCHDVIGDLGQECMITKNENELVLQTSLLFSKEDGLLSFLRKTLSTERLGTTGVEILRDARVEILGFLGTFLQRMSVIVRGWEKNYAVELKDACVVVYTKDKAAKCRGPALDLLIKILYLTKDSSIAQDLRIGDMFNKYYGELSQKHKIPDTGKWRSLLGYIYELLGVLGEVHPSEMVNNSDKLYRAFLGELKGQMTSTTKEPKLAVVAGCLKGVTALMVNFTKSMEEDPATSKDIFDYALKAISPQTDIKRYAVIFAGLKLFAKHSSQFGPCLMDHYLPIYEVMSKHCGHVNAELKKSSYAALESFLKQVATLVAENIELHKSKLKFFMQRFCSIIRTKESTNKELSIAIKGYGLFAAPCKVVCPQDVDLMYTELIQRCKQMYLTETDRDEDNVYQLPSFLDSIASVLVHLDRIPEVYTPVLERLVVVQMDSFPQYSSRMQYSSCRSIIKVFVAMAVRGPVLWSFTSSVVHQGLIRVCSKPVQYEEQRIASGVSQAQEDSTLVRSGKWKVPSSKDYLELFKGLLGCENLKDTGFMDGSPAAKDYNLRDLNQHLYDALVQSVMKILGKLDLSVQKVNVAEEPGGNGNLALLPFRNPEYFAQWMYPLCHELILQSIRFPLVSGFYKLLSLSMGISKKIHFFQEVKQGPKSRGCGSSMESACFSLLAKFGKEVCVRMKQYKDELLASCLIFVLSLHPNMVALDIKPYIPALQAALRLGLSHAPLATAALDALESWSSLVPAAVLEPHYPEILPYLDGYLKTTSSSEKDGSSMDVTFVSTGSSKGYGSVMMRLLKKSKQFSVGDESPISAVRRRVVRLLGHLGGQLNRSLVTGIYSSALHSVSGEDMMKSFVAWDCEKRLSFAVPFKDMKPEIYLDIFLPRVTELALSSSDRQTKVAACELLHSLVIYMVGKGAQMAENEKSAPPMYNLHRKVFPVLLRLACDVDQVTRQLFEPLVMQLIHWFTNNRKFESQDTVAVLDAILDGIVDPLDSTLRDFSGTCIQEFVKWSIKQTTPKQQEKSPANMKSLFKRIYSLALHPNVFKRLGAALAFNSMYRQFREESSLVEQFVFEVLVVFVESLALAHFDEKSLGTVQQCCSSLDHLKRIIKHKADSLNKNSKRRTPRGFSPDQSVCLADIVLWLLNQCNASPEAWLDAQTRKRGLGFLISCLEGGGLLSQPTLREIEAPFNIRSTLQWMDLLLAALDCYNTFTNLRCVQPQKILGTGEKSSFLPAIGFFLTELSMLDFQAARACFRLGTAGQSQFSPQETAQYNYSKCCIIVRLLEFSTMRMESDVFNSSFFMLLTLAVCEPSSIGFNMADLEVMTRLPEVCVPLLKALASTTYRTHLESGIRRRITAQSVYKSIAPGNDRKSLPSMDVGSRTLADRLSEQMVALLLNTITLSVPLSGSLNPHFLSFSHGEYFYSLFQRSLNTELLRSVDRTVPLLLSSANQNASMVSVLLNGMLDHSFRERSVRRSQGSQLAEQVLKGWSLLRPWWEGPGATPESKTSVLSLLSKVLQIDSSVCCKTDHPEFNIVFTTFTTLLTDASLPLNIKSQALIMVPFFTTLPTMPLEELRRALESLVVRHFPMQSDEFPRGSLQCNNYMDCIRKFLEALQLSQSPVLLTLMARVLCRDKTHIMEELFQTCFQNMARQSHLERQIVLLNTVYKSFQVKDVPSNSMLLGLIDRVLLPLATHCSPQSLSQFFITNIADIMTTVQARFTKSVEAVFESQIMMKIGCCKLLELLYSRLPKEEIYSKTSAINQAFCGTGSAEGNELSKNLLKCCFEAFTENMTGETVLIELRRQFHCAAYNCAIALISCSFNETKFYQGFLFTEKPDKNQFIFDNLVDTQRLYNFPVEVDVPIEKKKNSLSEEMSQFDFSTGVQSFSYSSQNLSGESSSSRTLDRKEVFFQDETVELEMDELNQHECMANMTALLRHMQRNNITPKIEEGVLPRDLPPWMKFLQGKLDNPSTPLNVRLFIAKLIINTEEIFRPYAKHWLGPMVQLVVSSSNGGEGIHFMVVDIVVTVLSWVSVATPKGSTRDEVLANRLLVFLVKNCFHNKRAVFRHNLEIIRTVVECWKDCLTIPYEYFQSLTNNLAFIRYKEVYSAAAEVIGLILSYMTERENQNDGPLFNLTVTKLAELRKKEMDDKFIICLSKVSKHFPPLVDRFINPVFYLLPKMHGLLKTHCLECVLSRADVIPEIFLHMKTKGLSQIMSHKDEARQRVCLDIIHKILACLKPEELKEILGAVTAFVSHPSPVCRERMYDILMWIQDNYRLYVRNFWSHERRLPPETMERMLVILKSLYTSRIEEQFLSLATDLILEMTSHSPDYSRNMFEFPLSECKFQDYTIDSNWRLRSTVLTPMFMETQGTQGTGTQGTDAAGSQAAALRGQIRATQTSLVFSQTQAPGAGDVVQHITAARERRADILRLKRRFLKDKEKENISFAMKEIQSQRSKQERRADLKVRQEAQVTLYRSYRLGDLPDIQIQYSSLIAPLQALAQRDATLAKQLFGALFAAVLKEMEGSKSNKEAADILKDLVQTLNSFLKTSTVYFPPFISCVQDMSYHHKALLGVEPSLVSSSCLASLQQPMGILLLEESLLHATVGSEQPPTKRARGRRELPPDTERWIHLAKLYRSLGDYDVVRGIFSGKIGTKAITFTALQAEAKSDYAEAVKLYNEALNKDDWLDGEPTNTEKDFWETAALEAYNHLTEWKSLQYCATVNIDDSSPIKLEKMWTEPFYVETYLQYMIRSMLKQLQLGQRSQDLLSFVDGAMKIEEQKMIMETLYSQELSLLYILQEDYDRAKYYANNCMQVFMQNYSSIDPLLNWSRLTLLQSVQALTEIQDFLNYITGEVSVSSLKFMIKQWTSHYPDAKLDPMNVWDDIITSRCFFLDKILERLASTPENSMELDGEEQGTKAELGDLVKNCKFNMKLQMADSAWKQKNFPVSSKLLKELHRDAKMDGERLVRWVHSFSRFTHKKTADLGSAEQINALLKTVPLLIDAESQSEALTTLMRRDQRILLGTTYDLMASAAVISPSAVETLGEDKVGEGLQMQALDLLRSAAHKAEEEQQSFSQQHAHTHGIVEAYMTLANFCDRRLRESEQKEETLGSKLQSFPGHVVKMMLKALKLSSEEARLKFPRLLQLVELYPAETLDLMVVDVPCWLLIGWISQMMALLDKPQAIAVQHVIEEIAECYPQALVYPYMISSENYTFEETLSGQRNREFVERLKCLLDKGGIIQEFVDALQQLTNPEMLFKDWWEEVKNQLDKPNRDEKKMKQLYEEVTDLLGDAKSPRFGSFRRNFVKKFSKDVEKLLGVAGSRLYERRKDERFISQYDGKSKPLPEYHAKITGFDERVKVMQSIRRPKQIIIRGDDERDHPFLVKGGEDLRQDQRIEQLFGVMNIILSQDAACSQRSLSLRTYQVIPITSRIGLIEWMENTSTLKDFLRGKRLDTINNFRRIEQMVPDDLLKRAFVKMSTTPEAFLSLRSHFSSSHAVLCISHWVLGIGDRHLSNFMINTETGGMIGIDFGHAFGSATQFLPVPELMPFRMTRQFVNLMRPLAESGLIKSVMVHSLRAFRADTDLLLNTMDVFVKEPSLDWKNFELRQLKKGGTWKETIDTREINWFPLQKVNFARRKLAGANPSLITREELRLGFEKAPEYKGMVAVARGEEADNIRARLSEKDLNVEDQVDCLIDQATDPNILGRVWSGWEPWM